MWTPKEHFAKKLESNSYSIIGQLYSNDGVNAIVRNILANPIIRTIIVCGQDRIGSADTLTKLVQNGINEKWEVIGKEESKVEKEIPQEAIELFRKNVEVIDMRGELHHENVKEAVAAVKQSEGQWADPQLFPEAEISTDRYPSEGSVYVQRGKTVGEVWPKILHAIMRFGEKKDSAHTEGTQRELLNLCAVVTDEDPDHIDFVDYFPFTREHFEQYKPQVMTAEPIPSLSYTYGMRLRDYQGMNQVESIIKKLKEEAWTRRAVGVLWNVEIDDRSNHPPCLNIVHAVIQYDKLHLTCYLRSNDMYRAWPENALAFRTMQKEICDGVGVELGLLTTIAGSGHVYEENYVAAQEIIDKQYPLLPCEQDPRGNYIIRIDRTKEGGYIEIIHQSPEGRKIGLYTGKTAMQIFDQISHDLGTSVRSHAFDLGAELQKAEIALKLGIDYTQDRPLPYKDICKDKK